MRNSVNGIKQFIKINQEAIEAEQVAFTRHIRNGHRILAVIPDGKDILEYIRGLEL